MLMQATVFRQFIKSLWERFHTDKGPVLLRLSQAPAPLFALSMALQRSAGSAWIVIMAPNRIQERPNDGTWETGRAELNGCQTLKAPQHVNEPTKAGRVHF